MRTPPLILIVDDNPANVEILQMRLAANNYDIITAADGEAGLTMAREKQPDLILLDIMMPKMDGLGSMQAAQKRFFLAIYANNNGYCQNRFQRYCCRSRSRWRRILN